MAFEDLRQAIRIELVEGNRVHVDQQAVVAATVRGKVNDEDVLARVHDLCQSVDSAFEIGPARQGSRCQAGRVVLQHQRMPRAGEAPGHQRVDVFDFIAENVLRTVATEGDSVDVCLAGNAWCKRGDGLAQGFRLRGKYL